jgi:hypothetical protein
VIQNPVKIGIHHGLWVGYGCDQDLFALIKLFGAVLVSRTVCACVIFYVCHHKAYAFSTGILLIMFLVKQIYVLEITIKKESLFFYMFFCQY